MKVLNCSPTPVWRFGTLTGIIPERGQTRRRAEYLVQRFTRYSGEQAQAVAAYVDIAKRHNLDPAQNGAGLCSQPFVASTLLGAATIWRSSRHKCGKSASDVKRRGLAEIGRRIRFIPIRRRDSRKCPVALRFRAYRINVSRITRSPPGIFTPV